MSAFLLAQMDYIYFFYGLSFVFFGVVCILSMENEKKDVPWIWLALFGLIHGFTEWIELLQIIFPTQVWLSILKILFLSSSFFFLFEGGRRAMDPQKKYRHSVWVYVGVILALSVGWRLNGMTGLTGSLRCTLGLFGAGLVGMAFWKLPYTKSWEKNFSRIGAFAFWFYALSQVFVTQDVYFEKLNIFLPLIRGVLAFILVMCIWFIFRAEEFHETIGRGSKKNHDINTKEVSFFYLFLLVTLIFGGFLTSVLGEIGKKEVGDEIQDTTEIIATNIKDVVLLAQNTASTLSLFPSIENALLDGEKDRESANLILDQYQKILGDSVCYLLNKDGLVIASSNRFAPDSFLGKNYAFRPYFKEAIQGRSGAYFATGITSKRSGFYASQPVKNSQGTVLGVVVIKINLDDFERVFRLNENVFIVNPDGVIFLSGKLQESGKTLVPLTDSLKNTLRESQQFGNASFEPLFSVWPQIGSTVVLHGQPMLVEAKKIGINNFALYQMHPLQRMYYYRLFGILLSFVFYLTLIAFLVVIQMIRRNIFSSYFTSIVHSSQDAIIGKDANGKIVAWNDGAEKMYGYEKDDVIEKTIDFLLPEDQREKNKRILHAMIHGKNIGMFNAKHIRKDGTFIDVSVTNSLVKDAGDRIIGFSMVTRDITRLIKLEKMKTEFVSIASHQLRTPLTGIKWFSELLLNGRCGALTPDQKKYLDEIASSNQRMITLVNDLLEVSHIDDKDAYKLMIAKEDFSTMINGVVKQQSVLAKMKNITIQLDPACLKSYDVQVDRIKIEQVLQNLISNAIKFSPEKSTIFITCKNQTGHVSCSIVDQGIGIPLKQQSRVFEKFFRADNAVKVGSTGTGLGLYIAKSIMEAHKGKIWFESEEGKGTTMTISFPVA